MSIGQKESSTDHDPDLAWLLTCGGSAMGERGTLGGIVSALEHGGHPGGVPNTDLYSEQQIGWGKFVYGDVEKHRWLMAAWVAVSKANQNVLVARYTAPRSRWARSGRKARLTPRSRPFGSAHTTTSQNPSTRSVFASSLIK